MTAGKPVLKTVMQKRRSFIIRSVTCALILLCAYALCLAQEDEQSLDRFNIVQYDDDGEKKWELSGKSAEVEKEKVNIDEISALAFGEETTLKLKAKTGSFDRGTSIMHLEDSVVMKTTDKTTLTTDSLNWDAETKNLFTDSPVSMKRAEFRVTGSGAEVDLENKTAELKKDVTANISSPETGILRTTSDERRTTEITCDGPLELNYKKNRAAFLNNVKVKDKEGDIFADRIDLYFSPSTRRIKCVVARGNVRIVNGDNVTYSEKAIYLVDEGRVVLPKRPKLVINEERSDEGIDRYE